MYTLWYFCWCTLAGIKLNRELHHSTQLRFCRGAVPVRIRKSHCIEDCFRVWPSSDAFMPVWVANKTETACIVTMCISCSMYLLKGSWLIDCICYVRRVGAAPANCRYPDTIAVCYSSVDNKLTCIYNDHSLYIWDVTDIRKVGKARSFLFHSGAVWGIDVSGPSLFSTSIAVLGINVICCHWFAELLHYCNIPTLTPDHQYVLYAVNAYRTCRQGSQLQAFKHKYAQKLEPVFPEKCWRHDVKCKLSYCSTL